MAKRNITKTTWDYGYLCACRAWVSVMVSNKLADEELRKLKRRKVDKKFCNTCNSPIRESGKIKISEIVAVMGWGSLFIVSWMLIARYIQSNGLSWGFFVFFLFVSICASALQMERKNVRISKRVSK